MTIFSEKVANKLEPEIINWTNDASANALLSIAISLKRIADMMGNNAKNVVGNEFPNDPELPDPERN